MVASFSAYLHSIGYSVDEFQRELDASVVHIKSQHPG
jgi:hypothetical protein